MKVAVKVTALLFARLREQAGADRFALELPDGSTGLRATELVNAV